MSETKDVEAGLSTIPIQIIDSDSVVSNGGNTLEPDTPRMVAQNSSVAVDGKVHQNTFDRQIKKINAMAGSVQIDSEDYQGWLTYAYYIGAAGLVISSLVALALDYNKMFDQVVYALTFVAIFLFISLWAFLARTNITSPTAKINIEYVGNYLPFTLTRRGFLAFLSFILAGSFALYLLYLAAWYNYVIDDHLTVQSTDKMSFGDAGVRKIGIKATFMFEDEVADYKAKYEATDPFLRDVSTSGHCYKKVDKNEEGKLVPVECEAPNSEWSAVKFNRKEYLTYDYFVDIDFNNKTQFNCGMVKAGKDDVSKCNSVSVTMDINNEFFEGIRSSVDTILFQIAPVNDKTMVTEEVDIKDIIEPSNSYSSFEEWCHRNKKSVDERCNVSHCRNKADNICFDQTSGVLDSQGNSCDYYTNRIQKCGEYDVDGGFQAKVMCCACSGGYPQNPKSCEDSNTSGKLDLGHDGCAYYIKYPEHCTLYDTKDFHAATDCCACGGGKKSNECEDTNGNALDSEGGDCLYYKTNPDQCGFFDDDDFKANLMCCGCSGGSSARISKKCGCEANNSQYCLHENGVGQGTCQTCPEGGEDYEFYCAINNPYSILAQRSCLQYCAGWKVSKQCSATTGVKVQVDQQSTEPTNFATFSEKCIEMCRDKDSSCCQIEELGTDSFKCKGTDSAIADAKVNTIRAIQLKDVSECQSHADCGTGKYCFDTGFYNTGKWNGIGECSDEGELEECCITGDADPIDQDTSKCPAESKCPTPCKSHNDCSTGYCMDSEYYEEGDWSGIGICSNDPKECCEYADADPFDRDTDKCPASSKCNESECTTHSECGTGYCYDIGRRVGENPKNIGKCSDEPAYCCEEFEADPFDGNTDNCPASSHCAEVNGKTCDVCIDEILQIRTSEVESCEYVWDYEGFPAPDVPAACKRFAGMEACEMILKMVCMDAIADAYDLTVCGDHVDGDHNLCGQGEFCYDGFCAPCEECHYCDDGIDGTCGSQCRPTREDKMCGGSAKDQGDDIDNPHGEFCFDHSSCSAGEFCYEGMCDSCSECHYCSDGIDGTCGPNCGAGYPTRENSNCGVEQEQPEVVVNPDSTGGDDSGRIIKTERKSFTPDNSRIAVYLSARDRSKEIKLRSNWKKKVHINGGEDTVLGFDLISDLETSGTTEIQRDACGEEPEGNIPTQIKFTFEFIADNKLNFEVITFTETLSYTLNDIWTGIMASSNALLAAFAFFFANTLPSRYFAWSSIEKEKKAKIEELESMKDTESVEMAKIANRITE
jgi:hypothetical protein